MPFGCACSKILGMVARSCRRYLAGDLLYSFKRPCGFHCPCAVERTQCACISRQLLFSRLFLIPTQSIWRSSSKRIEETKRQALIALSSRILAAFRAIGGGWDPSKVPRPWIKRCSRRQANVSSQPFFQRAVYPCSCISFRRGRLVFEGLQMFTPFPGNASGVHAFKFPLFAQKHFLFLKSLDASSIPRAVFILANNRCR